MKAVNCAKECWSTFTLLIILRAHVEAYYYSQLSRVQFAIIFVSSCSVYVFATQKRKAITLHNLRGDMLCSWPPIIWRKQRHTPPKPSHLDVNVIHVCSGGLFYLEYRWNMAVTTSLDVLSGWYSYRNHY